MTPKARGSNLENPFERSVSLPMLGLRLAAAACIVGGVFFAWRPLEWLSTVAMAWVLVVVWGRHVLFAENLAGLPNLGVDSGPPLPAPAPAVALIVPARNERVDIESAARTVAAIEYPELEILMVDDHSTDGTLEILQSLAREFPGLRVLSSPDVPPGWTGKTNASWFAFQRANPGAHWLLFTDARVKFHPLAVSRAVAHAEAKGLGFLSCIIRFEGEGVGEELIAIQQNRGLLSGARKFGGGPPATPFGLGAFSLIRREVYVRCGGHAFAPDHPLEDFVLAKSARDCGAPTAAAIASDLVGLRRYHGFADMQRRAVRTLRVGAGDSAIDLVNRISLELLLGLLPAMAVFAVTVRIVATRSVHPAVAAAGVLALLTWFAGASTPRLSKRICRFRPWLAWCYPAGAALSTWFLLLAIGERIRGRRISWRGRAVQPPSRAVI